MWELDHKESWAPKNWCFWTVVLEKILESPLDCKEMQPVNPKGNQSWIFIGRTDVEAETPILWPPDAKYWLIWKDPDAGKDWRQEENGTEDEMANGITDSMDLSLSKLQEMVKNRGAWVLQSMGSQRVRHDWVTEQQTTKEEKQLVFKTLHTDMTRWSTQKSDWLYSLQTKREKLYTVNKNKTRNWLWLQSWTPYYQIQT